ncbi:MAG TPA: hypothetical protein VMT17_18440 [Anaeromyxobacteraceae bacterium]|nr:hypothetical protein [Anaeromyxobacteraceae bacterium]
MTRLKHTLRVAIPALAAALSAPAWACSVCGCGDPLVAVGEAAGPQGQLGLELDGQWLTQTAGGDTPGTKDVLTQWSILLTASYSPIERLNVVVTLPYVFKLLQNEDSTGVKTTTSNLNGIGDLQFGLRWFFWEKVSFADRTRQSLALNAGTTAPTGSNDATVDGERVDEHGQLGTGGWGPYLGLFYRLQGDVWSGYGGVWGLYRTTNSYGYRFGSALLWTVAGQYQPVEWFAATLAIDGRYAGADVSDGAPVDSTGGFVLAAAPAVQFRIFKGAWLLARAQLPFATALNGIQTIGPVVTAGLRIEVL